jgi:hypothetical protein
LDVLEVERVIRCPENRVAIPSPFVAQWAGPESFDVEQDAFSGLGDSVAGFTHDNRGAVVQRIRLQNISIDTSNNE